MTNPPCDDIGKSLYRASTQNASAATVAKAKTATAGDDLEKRANKDQGVLGCVRNGGDKKPAKADTSARR
jgi:hypothetical protein